MAATVEDRVNNLYTNVVIYTYIILNLFRNFSHLIRMFLRNMVDNNILEHFVSGYLFGCNMTNQGNEESSQAGKYITRWNNLTEV